MPFNVGGLVKATFIGAASSAVTFGIGSAATSMFTNFYSQAAFQAAAHGTFQGSMTAISGGKFWSGFAAGALSSIASSVWSGGSTTETSFQTNSNLTEGHFVTHTFSHQGISGAVGANNTIGMIAFGTVSGGAGAAITGGNFWQGAVTGLIVSGLNHAAHKMWGERIDPPNKKSQNKPKTQQSKSDFKSGSAIMGYEGMLLNKSELLIQYSAKGASISNLRHVSKTLKLTAGAGKALGVAGVG